MAEKLPAVVSTNSDFERLQSGDALSVGAYAFPTAAGVEGQILIANASGYPVWGAYIPVPEGTDDGYVLKWDEDTDTCYWDTPPRAVPSSDTEGLVLTTTDGFGSYDWVARGVSLTSTYMVFVNSDTNFEGTGKLVFDGTNFTLATGSSLIGTDFTSTYMLYADANKKITSTSKLTFDGTNFTLASGSALISADILYLCPASNKCIQTTTTGNARGGRAVDLQFYRSADTQVASGTASCIPGGRNNTASGNYSLCAGYGNIASGTEATCFGGAGSQATSTGGFAHGFYAKADHYCQEVLAAGQFATAGDAQVSRLTARISTTDATATEMFLDGSTGTERLTIPTTSSWFFTIKVLGRQYNDDYSVNAYLIIGTISRDSGNAGIDWQTTISSNEEDSSWDCSVSADTTNQSLKITVTGAASNNIRWVAAIELVQIIA